MIFSHVTSMTLSLLNFLSSVFLTCKIGVGWFKDPVFRAVVRMNQDHALEIFSSMLCLWSLGKVGCGHLRALCHICNRVRGRHDTFPDLGLTF